MLVVSGGPCPRCTDGTTLIATYCDRGTWVCARHIGSPAAPAEKTPANLYQQVADMLNPPVGDPLITKEQALKLLDAEDLFTPPARPVRVGDRVNASGDYARVLRIQSDACVLQRDCDLDIGSGTFSLSIRWGDHLTHLDDGAPIDVPATLAALAKPANLAAHWVAEQDALAKRLGAEVDAHRWEVAGDQVVEAQKRRIAELEAKLATSQRTEQAALSVCESARAHRDEMSDMIGGLADEAGALATDLREAHETIGRQQRTIERLERDAKRGKR